MTITVRNFMPADWQAVEKIYTDAIAKGISTFTRSCPSYEEWDASHLQNARFVATNEHGDVIGFSTLSPTSSRVPYRGVCEVSVYVNERYRKQGIGKLLLQTLIDYAEGHTIWTLQASIFPFNTASIALHEACGFRKMGVRENIAKDIFDTWQSTVLMERRSTTIF